MTPIERAFERTKLVLFQDSSPSKWFLLGFCAWLASLGENARATFNWSQFDGRATARTAHWMEQNAPLVLLLFCAGCFLSVLLVGVQSWLSARGTFMFLDGIVHNRGAVSQPWTEFRRRGNRLALAKLTLGLTALLIFIGAVGLGFGIAWTDIRAGRFREAAALGLIVGLVALIVPSILLALVNWFLRNLIAPTMYLRDVSVFEAWDVVKSEVVNRHVGTLAIYFLMRVAIGIAIGIMTVVAVCMTCCLLALPYLRTVALLPLFVFDRSYTLYFLEQFGENWRFFSSAPVATEPTA